MNQKKDSVEILKKFLQEFRNDPGAIPTGMLRGIPETILQGIPGKINE